MSIKKFIIHDTNDISISDGNYKCHSWDKNSLREMFDNDIFIPLYDLIDYHHVVYQYNNDNYEVSISVKFISIDQPPISLSDIECELIEKGIKYLGQKLEIASKKYNI